MQRKTYKKKDTMATVSSTKEKDLLLEDVSDDAIPEGSMSVQQFEQLLKNSIRKHYEKQRSGHLAECNQ